MIPAGIQRRVDKAATLSENGINFTKDEIKRLWQMDVINIGEACYLLSEIRRATRRKTQRMWTDRDIERLIEMYKDGLSQTEISKKLGYTRQQVNAKLSNLSKRKLITRRPPPGAKWTPAEDAIIVQYYRTHTVQEMSEMIPGRSPSSVASRIRYLLDNRVLVRKRRGYYTRG